MDKFDKIRSYGYCCEYGVQLHFAKGKEAYDLHAEKCVEVIIVKYAQHTEMFDEEGEEIDDFLDNEIIPLYKVWVFIDGQYEMQYSEHALEFEDAFTYAYEKLLQLGR